MCVWYAQGTARRPMWLNQSEKWGVVANEVREIGISQSCSALDHS